MKQTLFMTALTLVGTVGLFVSPIYGILVYYLFAVLRPQYLWMWALPAQVPWSQIVAIPTILFVVLHRFTDREDPFAETPSSSAFTWAHKAALLFALWVILSYFMAQNAEVGRPVFIDYLKIFTMFFASALFIRSVDDIWKLMLIAAASLAYISYEVNFLYLTSYYMGIYFNGYAGLDNNGAGLMLAMGVPLCLFVWMGTDKWWRWVFAAQIPVILHAVILTFSRGAWVALIAAAPLMFLRGKNRGQLVLAALGLAILIPLMAGGEVREEFFSTSDYGEDNSAQARFGSWTAAFRIALDYPVFGVGVRNSSLFSFDYGADIPGRVIHNQFLQIAADSGFPALGFYLLFLGIVAVNVRKVRRWARPRTDEQGQRVYAIAAGLETTLALFCVGAVFLSLEVFELPYLLLLLGAQLPIALRSQMATPVPAPRIDAWTGPRVTGPGFRRPEPARRFVVRS